MFHNMEYVYCIYKERSFSKAAEKLHISQPSLSAMVRKIEKQAGASIFERKTRPVSLTPFGIEFVQGIEQIFEIEERLQQYVYELHTLESGSVAIGGSNLSVSYIVPQKIAAFKLAYPKIDLRIVEKDTLTCKQMLDNGELDLMVTNRPMNADEYHKIVCYEEELVVTVPQNFPINQGLEKNRLTPEELDGQVASVPIQRGISPAELAGVPLILLHRGNYLRLCSDIMFQNCQVEPNIILEVDKSSIAYNFARLGLGATIISSVLVESSHRDSGLYFYRLNSPQTRREAFICYRKGHHVSMAMRRLIEMLVER